MSTNEKPQPSAKPPAADPLEDLTIVVYGWPGPRNTVQAPNPALPMDDRSVAIVSFIAQAMRISFLARVRSVHEREVCKGLIEYKPERYEWDVREVERLLALPPDECGLFSGFDMRDPTLRAFMRYMSKALKAPKPEWEDSAFMINYGQLLKYYLQVATISLDDLKRLGAPKPPLPPKPHHIRRDASQEGV